MDSWLEKGESAWCACSVLEREKIGPATAEKGRWGGRIDRQRTSESVASRREHSRRAPMTTTTTTTATTKRVDDDDVRGSTTPGCSEFSSGRSMNRSADTFRILANVGRSRIFLSLVCSLFSPRVFSTIVIFFFFLSLKRSF